MDNFTEEELSQDNKQVNDLCGCSGKGLTLSRRTLREAHEDWCWYLMYLNDQKKTDEQLAD